MSSISGRQKDSLKFKLIFLAILFCGVFGVGVSGAKAETYFIRNNGTASESAATLINGGGCASDATAMNLAAHNVAVFLPGDTIYVCNTITGLVGLNPPSSGSSENYITYRGDYPGFPGLMNQDIYESSLARMLYIQNKQYLRILNLNFSSNVGAEQDEYDGGAAIWIEENYQPTGHIEINGCSFFETCSGIVTRGDVQYVDVYKSTFENMVNSGVWMSYYWGRGDDLVPSFVTVGGSRDNGNTFVNIGRENTPEDGSVPGETLGVRGYDVIFSYNHVYADSPGWGTGIYMNGVKRVLVEYNYFHDLDSTHRRPTVTFKTDLDLKNEDVVIRFNKLGPSHGGETYIDTTSEIMIDACIDKFMVYGNYIIDAADEGISSNWGWNNTQGGGSTASDGCNMENLYIYSNIIDRTGTASGISLSGCNTSTNGECTDLFRNSYIMNNLVYHAVDDDATGSAYGIKAHKSDAHYDGLTIKNNIIDTPRDTAIDHIGLSVATQADLAVDYNHHFFPGAIPAVNYYDDCVGCAWNSSSRPAGYGTHDTEGSPLYVDASSGNFALTQASPCRDTGETISTSIPSVSIQGNVYNFSFSEALDPARSDWSATLPIVFTANQNSYGSGWEKGAYVYDPAGDIIPPTAPGGLRVE